ncbi:Ig-like domain-containing protein [Bacillus sp. AFS041924]|uniref:Ig-like domain-containing protein n=1 Tax=Bacillus sp. AFS041924 TaxID=2033503 RepID=UPI00159BA550|nr:Ig-like domain-containing protein [Bacillus sp. AFS041924]
MFNKIISVLLGVFLFLLPTANATSFSPGFSDDELSNYIDNLNLNTTEATFGQSIEIGVTTKKHFDSVALTFKNGASVTEVLLKNPSSSDLYYSGKIGVTSSFAKGTYQLSSITLGDQTLPVSDQKVKFLIKDLPTPIINPITNKSTSINGTFLENSSVQLSINKKLVGNVQTDAKGNYRFNTKPLKAFTKINIVGVSIGIKSKFATSTVSDVIAPSVTSISSISDHSQNISGKSEPYADVIVNLNKKVLVKGKVNSAGKFNIKMAKQKANSILQVVAIDKSKNQSKPVSIRVLDRTAPSKPTIQTVKENSTVISGKTEAKASVKLYLKNKYVAKITASKYGSYSFKVSKLKAFTPIKVQAIDAAGNQSKPSFTEAKSSKPLSNGQLIIVNTKTNKLSYYNKGKLVKTFRVATGKASSPTPTGKFKVLNKIKNRPWYKENIPGGAPNNPLGKRWMGLSMGSSPGNSYGIHGNANESSIGKSVSSGCIRMHNSEIEWLFDQINVGTTVIIAKTSSSNGQIAHSYGMAIT